MRFSMAEEWARLKQARVAVLGIGVSNLPLIRMLLHAGIDVTARDRRTREDLDASVRELEALGADVRLGEHYLDDLDGYGCLIRTPGMRPDLPPLERARARGCTITSEMEIFFEICPCPIFGVTGSDGKTTTTTILARLLETAGYCVHLGGNIGKPLLPEVEQISPTDVAVVELSSFQLMTMDLSPHVAVVTNLAPNHLDVHRSMEEYVQAKKNIFLHQEAQDRVILNADNPITRSFATEAPGNVTLFSRRIEPDGDTAVFVRDRTIWLRNAGQERAILPCQDIRIPGDHNVENYMAALAAVDGLVSDDSIRAFAAEFPGVEHRIELVRTLNGVRYYNDSIASSPTRTIAGLQCFPEPVILIAGGYDKHIPFDTLGPEIVRHVKRLILTGDTAPKIRAAVEAASRSTGKGPLLEEYAGFQEAVEAAHRAAQPGDVVLLSPACASFDHFRNFMERGSTFKQIVNTLGEEPT